MIEAFCAQKDRPIGDQKAVNYCFKKKCKYLRFCVRRSPRFRKGDNNYVQNLFCAILIMVIAKKSPHNQTTAELIVMIWETRNGKKHSAGCNV